MRDPDRIEPFLRRLGEVWKQAPDWRFGQLVMNLTRRPDNTFADPWDWEEDDWEEAFAEFKGSEELSGEEVQRRAEEVLKKILGEEGE